MMRLCEKHRDEWDAWLDSKPPAPQINLDGTGDGNVRNAVDKLNARFRDWRERLLAVREMIRKECRAKCGSSK